LLVIPLAGLFRPENFPADYALVAALPVVFLAETLFQVLVLWPTGRSRALWWFPVKGLAYLLTPYLSALIVIPVINQAPFPGFGNTLFAFYTAFMAISSTIGLIPGLIVGLITGLFLLWLLPRPETQPDPPPPVKPGLVLLVSTAALALLFAALYATAQLLPGSPGRAALEVVLPGGDAAGSGWRALAFTGDADTLALLNNAGGVDLYRLDEGMQLQEQLPGRVPEGRLLVAHAPAGLVSAGMIAAAGGDTVLLWRHDGSHWSSIPLNTGEATVQDLAFNPAGSLLAAAGLHPAGNRVLFWDMTDPHLDADSAPETLTVPGAACTRLAFGGGEKPYLACGAATGTLTLWPLNTAGMAIAETFILDEPVQRLAYSIPQGQFIVAAGDSMYTVTPGSPSPRLVYSAGSPITSLSAAAESPLLMAAAGNNVYLWETAITKWPSLVFQEEDTVSAVAVSPDGRHQVALTPRGICFLNNLTILGDPAYE